MTELLALGASHKTAPLALRERLAVTDAAAERLLHELVEHPSISEAVVLSTCNRIELYVVVADPVEAESVVLGMLARRAGIRPTELVDGIYALRNCDAARHLFRVTAGLDSMVVGEAEIQGQVKRAYETALENQTTGSLTNRLFRGALAAGKRARTETRISVGHASVASVAVDLAEEAIGDLQTRPVLIVGAGETAELTARALHDHGVKSMFVANRRRERAHALAERFGGETVSLDALDDQLELADIVVTSTASPHVLIEAERLSRVMELRGRRQLLLIDLAVPRDLDPAINDLDGCFLYDVDDLEAVVAETLAGRRGEAARAERIVAAEADRFREWQASLDVVPAIASLQALAEEIRAAELAKLEGRLGRLSEAERRAVEAATAQILNKLLHLPTVRLKEAAAGAEGVGYADAVRHLFGLEDER